MPCLKSLTVHILIRGFTLFFVGLTRFLFSISLSVTMVIINYITINQNPRLHLVPSRSWTSLPVSCSSPKIRPSSLACIIPSLLSFTSTCVIFFNLLLSTFSACFYNQFPHLFIKTHSTHSSVTLTTKCPPCDPSGPSIPVTYA